jgi:hypothetical protein
MTAAFITLAFIEVLTAGAALIAFIANTLMDPIDTFVGLARRRRHID